MLAQILKPLVVFTIAIIVLWIITRLFFKKKYAAYFASFTQEILFVAFIVYLGWMFCVTLYPTSMTFYKRAGSGEVNLIPVATTVKDFMYGLSLHEVYARPYIYYLLKTAIGNLVLFVPFGFLLPQVSKFKAFKEMILAALLLSAGIEITQFFLRFIHIYRSPDVDDIILNVSGAVVGFFILVAVRNLRFKI